MNVLEIIRAGFGIICIARFAAAIDKTVFKTTVLIIMNKHTAFIITGAVHSHSLKIPPGTFIGITHDIGNMQAAAVFPYNTGVRPQITFIAVGIFILYSINRDSRRQKSRDKMKLVNIMTSNVCEHI